MSTANAHGDQRVLAASLAGIVAVGVVFHAGAFVATAITNGEFHSSLPDSIGALFLIWTDPSHPSGAWRSPSHISVGPVAFWIVESLLLTLVVSAVAVTWSQISARRNSNPFRTHRHVGFARNGSLRSLHVDQPQPGRLTLGHAGRHLIATEPQTSLAVIGPTGCGKTAGFAIPALLEWNGPIIATSVKSDLITATISHRRSRGKVWVYDPTRCSGEESSQWTPLEACKDWQGALRMSAWLCEAAQPRLDTVSDGDYWYTQARKALAPYLFAAASAGKTMTDVVAWIDCQERDTVERALRLAASIDSEIESILASDEGTTLRKAARRRVRPRVIRAMRESFLQSGADFADYAEQPHSEWPTVFQEQLDETVEIDANVSVRFEVEERLLAESSMQTRVAPLVSARSLWEKDQRLRDSVFATVQNVLTCYGDPSVIEVAQSCEIDFAEWLSGDNTIYVVATSHEQARLRPLLTVLVQQAVRAVYDTALRNGGALATPCLALIDEAGNTAPLRDLPNYASTARSHNLSLVTVWQDMAQVKSIYRDRANTVLNNHRAVLFGTGISDAETLEYVSKLIGEVAETQRNYSRDLNSDRRSVSEHTNYRRAAPIDVVRRMRVNEAVLLYGSELPAHVRLRPWFDDAHLRSLAQPSTDQREAS